MAVRPHYSGLLLAIPKAHGPIFLHRHPRPGMNPVIDFVIQMNDAMYAASLLGYIALGEQGRVSVAH